MGTNMTYYLKFDQKNQNIVIVNIESFASLPFCRDSISELIKPFGVDVVLWRKTT